MRQNPVDIHGRISWTPAAPERSRATSSASFSRSAVRNGARPAATTTNGSAGAISVHSAGRLTSSPASSNTYTRSVRVHPVPELPDQGPALRRQGRTGRYSPPSLPAEIRRARLLRPRSELGTPTADSPLSVLAHDLLVPTHQPGTRDQAVPCDRDPLGPVPSYRSG